MAADRDIFVNRGIVFYRAVGPQQRNDMDTTEEDRLEKRGFPSFDVYQSCCSDSFCLLPIFHSQRSGSAAYPQREQHSAASGQLDSVC